MGVVVAVGVVAVSNMNNEDKCMHMAWLGWGPQIYLSPGVNLHWFGLV